MMHRVRTTIMSVLIAVGVSLSLSVTGAQAAPAITSPSPGGTLSGATETFSWTAGGTTVNAWWINVGTSTGGVEIYDSGSLGTATSDTVNGLPTDGSTVHVRLWYSTPTQWEFTDFTFTAFTSGGGSGGGGEGNATLRWDRNGYQTERFVRVMPSFSNFPITILDNTTGLVWQIAPGDTNGDQFVSNADKVTWGQARAHCLTQTDGGVMGWRLPSIHELYSLGDPINPNGNPALPAGHPFLGIKSERYWTASTSGILPDRAHFVDFGNLLLSGADTKQTNAHFVWCVRGGGPLSEY